MCAWLRITISNYTCESQSWNNTGRQLDNKEDRELYCTNTSLSRQNKGNLFENTVGLIYDLWMAGCEVNKTKRLSKGLSVSILSGTAFDRFSENKSAKFSVRMTILGYLN